MFIFNTLLIDAIWASVSIPAPGTLQLIENQLVNLLLSDAESVYIGFASLSRLAWSLSMHKDDLHNLPLPFKKARFVRAATGRSYIVFYVWHLQKNKLIRKRDYIPTEIKKSQQAEFIRDRVASINKLLKDGFYIDESKEAPLAFSMTRPSMVTVDQAVQVAHKFKVASLGSEHTVRTYVSARNKFMDWAKANKIAYQNVGILDHRWAMHFQDSLLIGGMSNKGVNNYISMIRCLFEEMQHREMIERNPFERVKWLKEIVTSKNMAFAEGLTPMITDEMKALYPVLYQYIQFIYYAFMRPGEVSRLQFKHIDMQRSLIQIPAANTKIKRSEYVVMPKPLRRVVLELAPQIYGGEDYLFGRNNKPGPKPHSRHLMSERHRAIMNRVGLGQDYTLYGWKHTGVVRAVKAGVGLKDIQRQCRHTSLDMTDRYLKSLGLHADDSFSGNVPEI